MEFVIAACIVFLIGSTPTGLVIGKLYGCDLRKSGSGNIGATNALRTLGKKAGLLTFLGDLLKGFVPIIILSNLTPTLQQAAPFLGLLIIVGHCFSPFLKFNGGKGVATSLGVFLAIVPIQSLLAVAVFAAVVKLSGYVSLGSICSLTFAAIAVLLTPDHNPETLIAIIAAAALVITRHKANIQRLIAGQELPYKSA